MVNQVQNTGKIFRIPMAIDVYENGSKTRHTVWLGKESDSFYFPYHQKPDLINVDGDKIILCQKQDNKTLENFIYQYKHAGLYLDRREAIEYCAEHQDDPAARALLMQSLKDPYFELRSLTINRLDFEKPSVKKDAEPVLLDLSKNDPNSTVKGLAIGYLGTYKNQEYKNMFLKMAHDSSYTVAGNALAALSLLDEAQAYELAKQFAKYPAKGDLFYSMATLFVVEEDKEEFDQIIDGFKMAPMSEQKFAEGPQILAGLISRSDNTEQVKRAVDAVTQMGEGLSPGEKKELNKLVNSYLNQIAKMKESQGLKDQAEYIKMSMK